MLFGGFNLNSNANTIRLDFSATIVQGTCSLNLDKSVLSLDQVSQSRLQSNSLVNAQPFNVIASNCIGVAQANIQPVIFVTGVGGYQDGKWLFRSSDSDVGGAGVILVQSVTQPSYLDSEVKSGDAFPLAAVGQAPADMVLPFFAGVSCGGSTGCATVKPGLLTANIVFNFAYR